MSRTATELAILALAFAAGSLAAAAAGAANAGIALTFGELAFVPALVWVLVRR
ncbi:MAG: hypothetical protein ACR2G3_08090 [Solirubrobacterales bacterium]